MVAKERQLHCTGAVAGALGPYEGAVTRWQKDGCEQLAGMGVECQFSSSTVEAINHGDFQDSGIFQIFFCYWFLN